MDKTTDPKQKKALQDAANRILDDVISQSSDVEKSFSKSVGKNPFLRGLDVGTEVASMAEIPALIKGGVAFLGKQGTKLFGKEAVKESVKAAGKDTIKTLNFADGANALGETAQEVTKKGGKGLLGKAQQFIEFAKSKTPAAQLAKKQTEEAMKVTTDTNIAERLINSVSKVAKADPDIARQLPKETSVLKEIKDIPTLLERMQYWGRNGYNAAGGVKAGAKGEIYKQLYQGGLDILQTEAPEVYKYRRLLGYTHQLDKNAGKTLWRLVLVAGAALGFKSVF
jgi:hypothetical protein